MAQPSHSNCGSEAAVLKELLAQLRELSPSDVLDTIREERRQVDDLLQSLRKDSMTVMSFSLSPQQASIYSALKKYGKVSQENLMDTLYHNQIDTPQPPIIRALIFKLRKKLPPDEKIVTLRGWGWAFEKKQKGNESGLNVSDVSSASCNL